MANLSNWISKNLDEPWMESLLENCIPVAIEAWIDDAQEGTLSAGLTEKELKKMLKEVTE